MKKSFLLIGSVILLSLLSCNERKNMDSYIKALKEGDPESVMNKDDAESSFDFEPANVDPLLFKDYEGKYIAGPEQSMIITSDSSTVYSEISGYGQPFRLIPISDVLYQFEHNNEKVVFIRDTVGDVVNLIYFEFGYKPWTAVKDLDFIPSDQ